MYRRFLNILFNPLLRSSWRSVALLWKPMAAWTLLVYVIFTALLAPLFLSLLNWGVFRGDRLIAGNKEFYTWFFSPAGFTYLFLALLITLTGIVIRFAGIFQILTDHLLGQKISVLHTALHIAPRVHILIKLCAVTISAAVLLLVPLFLGLGLIYSIYLTDFDINYYFLSTPPEWYRALTWGGIWVFCWSLFALLAAACTLPSLPAFLDGKKSIYEAFKEVWSAPMARILRLIKSVSVAAGIWFLLRFTSDSFFLFTFIQLAGLIQTDLESLRLLAFFSGSYLFLTLFSGSVISFFGFSLISTIITKFYYTHTYPSTEPDPPGLKTLSRKTFAIVTWWLKPARSSALILVLLAGSITSSILIAGDEPEQRNVLVISHRANVPPAPENSLAALESSILIGADYAEIDVQLTADGTAVVLHDADLMRVAGDPRRIADVTYNEIRDLLLITDMDLSPSEHAIPTLAQFLERSGNRIGLMIELKYYGFYNDLAEEVVRLVREFEMEDQVLIKSLDLPAVRQMREVASDLDMGYVSAVALGDISRLPISYLSVNHQNLTPALISSAAQRGLPVYAWTINRQEDMFKAIERGADGLITDRPELAIRVIEEFSGLTRAERILLQLGLIVLQPELDS